MTWRDQIFTEVRAAVGGARSRADEDRLADRLRDHPRNLVPKRAQLTRGARRGLFVDMAI